MIVTKKVGSGVGSEQGLEMEPPALDRQELGEEVI